MEVGSKALMTLSIIPNPLQVIWQRCRDMVAHVLHAVIMVIWTHVFGGDGYPRWHESVKSFFSAVASFPLLNDVKRP